MASSIKASPQGIALIDRARQRRGWTKTCTARWWQEAHTSRATLRRFWRGERIQQEAFIAICQVVGVSNWKAVADFADVESVEFPSPPPPPLVPYMDWQEAPDVETFYGRSQELQQLEQWMVIDSCKLVTVAGLGGIGKTRLALALVDRIQHQFASLVWRSLQSAPSLSHLLSSLLATFNQPITQDIAQDTNQLLQYFLQYRCLVILDSLEAVFHRPNETEAYNTFLWRIRNERHQSCLLVTSRELLQVMEAWITDSVQCLLLKGLQPMEALQLLLSQGFTGKEVGLASLVQLYRGNPLALKMIATLIQSIFGGNVAAFLDQNTLVIGDRLKATLKQQVAMLSGLERDMAYWLAIWQEPIPLCRLQVQLFGSPDPGLVLDALVALERRLLLEKHFTPDGPLFTMHPLIMAMVTYAVLEQAIQEITQMIGSNSIQSCSVLRTHQLMRPSTDTITGNSLLTQLMKQLWILQGAALPQHLSKILLLLQDQPPLVVGYMGWNITSLLRQTDLKERQVGKF